MTRDLLDAIIAAPDDDAPRRVYADALLDEGEPLGELINIQLDLAAGTLTRDERAVRRQRERELLAEHGKRWARLADLVTQPPRFRRGFVDEVSIDGHVFATRGEELFERAPLLRGVSLDGIAEEDSFRHVLQKYEQALRSPLLPRLHGLRCVVESWIVTGYESRIEEHAMAVHAMPALLDAIARMPQLRALGMFDPEEMLDDVVKSGVLARLDRIDVTGFPYHNVQAMLDVLPADRVRSLTLPLLGQKELVTVLGHPRMHDIEELAFSKPMFDTNVGEIVAIVRTFAKLRRLQLADLRGEPVALDLEEIDTPKNRTVSVFGWS